MDWDGTDQSYGLDPFEAALPPPMTPTQARANALRTPKRTSTSVTQTVVSPTTPQDKTPPPTPGAAPQGLRQSSVQRAQQALPDQYAALEKAMAPQDYTQMQDYAKQRTRQGQHSLLLALAAQEAGKEFEPIGGMYLKQAMEARQPLKTSTGFISPEGQHVEDAQAVADQKVKQITAQIQRNEQILSSAATAEEKEQARRDNIELKREQMAATMELRRMTAAIAQGSRADRAADRTSANNDRIGARVYDDFMRNTKDQQTQVNAYRNLQATAQRADAASDLSFIFQYMKMLDPGSVVRESEYATAQNARGVPDTIRNLYNSVMEGRRLTPQQREQFLGTAGNLAAEAEQRMAQVRNDLVRQLPPGTDPGVYLPGASPAEQGPPQGAVRVRGAQAPAPAAVAPDAPPPGAVRVKR